MKYTTQIAITNIDNNADGVIDDQEKEEKLYDNKNKLLTDVYEEGTLNGSPIFRRTTSNTYDTQGNLTYSLQEDDFGADGSIEYQVEIYSNPQSVVRI